MSKMTAGIEKKQLAKYVRQARAQYAAGSNDDIEIDDEPKVSPAADCSGVWVQAWVWVSEEEIK